MGSLINPNCASSLQARKVAGPLTIDQKSDWHKCLESIICSDDVQLSSEAMGVYELQASPKFKSLNELIRLRENERCRT